MKCPQLVRKLSFLFGGPLLLLIGSMAKVCVPKFEFQTRVCMCVCVSVYVCACLSMKGGWAFLLSIVNISSLFAQSTSTPTSNFVFFFLFLISRAELRWIGFPFDLKASLSLFSLVRYFSLFHIFRLPIFTWNDFSLFILSFLSELSSMVSRSQFRLNEKSNGIDSRNELPIIAAAA